MGRQNSLSQRLWDEKRLRPVASVLGPSRRPDGAGLGQSASGVLLTGGKRQTVHLSAAQFFQSGLTLLMSARAVGGET